VTAAEVEVALLLSPPYTGGDGVGTVSQAGGQERRASRRERISAPTWGTHTKFSDVELAYQRALELFNNFAWQLVDSSTLNGREIVPNEIKGHGVVADAAEHVPIRLG
jgi:hypothetical protein